MHLLHQVYISSISHTFEPNTVVPPNPELYGCLADSQVRIPVLAHKIPLVSKATLELTRGCIHCEVAIKSTVIDNCMVM